MLTLGSWCSTGSRQTMCGISTVPCILSYVMLCYELQIMREKNFMCNGSIFSEEETK